MKKLLALSILGLVGCGQAQTPTQLSPAQNVNQPGYECAAGYCTSLINAGASAQMVQGKSIASTVVCDVVLVQQTVGGVITTYMTSMPGDSGYTGSPGLQGALKDGYYYPQSAATRAANAPLCWFNITNGTLNPNAPQPDLSGDVGGDDDGNDNPT